MLNFGDKHPLSTNLFWSARFESWNQRNNDVYYCITIFKKKGEKYIPQNNFTVTKYCTDDYLKEDGSLFERLAVLVEKSCFD